jgi:hypothetical protein
MEKKPDRGFEIGGCSAAGGDQREEREIAKADSRNRHLLTTKPR